MNYSVITNNQMQKIVAIIRAVCAKDADKERSDRNKISDVLYTKLKKGRKAHDVTGDIYVAFFYEENAIDGMDTVLVDNGIYSQPEISNDNVIVHIYHESNRLNSNLIKHRLDNDERVFLCLRYGRNDDGYLKSIECIEIKPNGVLLSSEKYNISFSKTVEV